MHLPGALSFIWLVYAKDPQTPPPRSWRGLVGYSRLDVVVRILLAAIYPTGARDEDSALLLFLDKSGDGGEGRLLVFDAECLPNKALYEHELGPVVLRALRGEACMGLSDVSLYYVIRGYRRRGFRVVALREAGKPLDKGALDKSLLVLGSYFDPPERVLSEADAVYSVGPCSYLASHVAAYISALRLGAVTVL